MSASRAARRDGARKQARVNKNVTLPTELVELMVKNLDMCSDLFTLLVKNAKPDPTPDDAADLESMCAWSAEIAKLTALVRVNLTR